MSEPQRVDASTQPVAGGEKPKVYKSLLNEYAQKLWKQLPIYQTHNEGSDHLPKFRSTVWADGVSYTSPNTFQQRKMAEMDASKIALFATMHKLKNEALRLVHQDKSFCKSILVEYAARKNIQKPTYETSQLNTPVPVFRSSLVFNDVSCTGDDCKTKKEAEQSAARVAILKYLDSCADSDSESVMSEIINCKFRNYAEMKNIPCALHGTNAVVQTNVVVQTGVDNNTDAVVQTGVDNNTDAVVQTGVDNNIHAVVQTGVVNNTNAVVQTGVDNCVTLNEGKVEEGTKMLNTTALPEPSLVQGTIIHARHIPEESTQALTSVNPVPTVLTQAPYAGTNSAPISSGVSAPSLEYLARIIANHLSSNMVRAANSEASSAIVAPLSLPSPILTQPTVVSQTSSKKRNRKNKKNAQKKMRAGDQCYFSAIWRAILVVDACHSSEPSS
ncbi:hypothetical protein L6452_10467 [Arctium lappa]|uniref:Uncharacterized protein n=1 Tax=Arctium lappa TaxID=4217 RepID=A0ACB9DM90_ARCLA|nr:hypothetical protein L6452_10467 [Arctium lappa]